MTDYHDPYGPTTDLIGHRPSNMDEQPRFHKCMLPRQTTKRYLGKGGDIGFDPKGAGRGTFKNPAQQSFKRKGS